MSKQNNLDDKKDKLLKESFKNKKSFKDSYGRKVTKENAEIDHILPKAKGGNNNYDNLEVISRKSNREKSDKMSGTMSNGVKFKVTRTSKNNKVGKVTTKKP